MKSKTDGVPNHQQSLGGAKEANVFESTVCYVEICYVEITMILMIQK